MVAEATSQSSQSGFALPAGIHRRQSWRPAALRGAHSILSGIAARIKPLEGQKARLTAWYEQFMQRSQPFVGWQPLTNVEFGADGTQSSFDSPQQERITRSESVTSPNDLSTLARPASLAQEQAPTTRLQRFQGEPQRPEVPVIIDRAISGPIHPSSKSVLPSESLAGDLSPRHEPPKQAAVQPFAPATRRQAVDSPPIEALASEERPIPADEGRLAAENRGVVSPPRASSRSQEQPLVRPPLRLAILRPINTAAVTVQRKEADPLSFDSSRQSMAETKDFGFQHWPIEPQLAVKPRLVSTVSSSPRQEVRGDFPANVKGEVRPDPDNFSEDLVRVPLRNLSNSQDDGVLQSGALGSPREAEIPRPAAISPLALPEVQIRLLRPDESAIQTSENNFAKPGRSTIATSKPQTPPAAPPPLDINAVADRVYQTLQRRHQLERERRGLY